MSRADNNIINRWAEDFANGIFENPYNINEDNHYAGLYDEFENYKKTWKKLDEMQQMQQFDTDKAWNKLYNKITTKGNAVYSPKKRLVIINKILAMAASVIILIGVVGFLVFEIHYSKVVSVNNSLKAKMVTLPDGSEVYLNANSEIRYPKKFKNSKRTVKIKGEAFFNITKDKKRPFVVQANNAFIKVLGTSYNVNINDQFVEVIVKTGKVEVYSKQSSLPHIILLPGERSVFLSNNEIKKYTNSNKNYLGWLNKKLVFKELPLSIVINDIMNTYHCNIELADSAIANLKITSTFDNDSIDDVLESISLAFNLNVVKKEGKYILVSN